MKNNKSYLINRCKQILSHHNIGDILQGDELSFMSSLLKNHYKYGQEKIKQIKIGVNEFNKRLKEFRFINKSNKEISFSYGKCITHTSIDKNNIIRAFREAILPQIKEFKEKIFNQGKVHCAMTGVELTWEDCHIDHQNKFRHILKEFLDKEGLKYKDIQIINKPNSLPKIKDEELKKKWIEYHRRHAILRPLHKSVNLRLH